MEECNITFACVGRSVVEYAKPDADGPAIFGFGRSRLRNRTYQARETSTSPSLSPLPTFSSLTQCILSASTVRDQLGGSLVSYSTSFALIVVYYISAADH